MSRESVTAEGLSRRFWDKYYRDYDVLNELAPYQELLTRITEALEVREGDKILDLGSGSGNLSRYLVDRGANVVGIDNNRSALNLFDKKMPGTETVLGDITEPLILRDELFDKIATNNVIYAIPVEQRAALAKELWRVLKPGGSIVVANVAPWFKPFEIYKAQFGLELKKRGLGQTFLKALFFAGPTVRILAANKKIMRESSQGSYAFLSKEDQERFLEDGGFEEIEDLGLAYAGQSVVHRAKKF